jgi:protein-S-isoprenylcysteine O-methyltransferase Ste14
VKTFYVCLLAASISTYWLTVIIKSVLISPKIGKLPNVLPKEWLGALSRLIMLPMIILWIILPYHTLFYGPLPHLAWVSMLGATLAFLSLILSFYSWHAMGNSWRIGIDNKEDTQLITKGPFRYIRHPIYTLSILLMLGTFLTLQSYAAFYLLCVHFLLFYTEARREEAFLVKKHQANYTNYIKVTGRFFPKLIRR